MHSQKSTDRFCFMYFLPATLPKMLFLNQAMGAVMQLSEGAGFDPCRDRGLRTHSSLPAQQWALRPPQPPPSHLWFVPTKGILEWLYTLLWNSCRDISQYVSLKKHKWFQRTQCQNGISSCCNMTYDKHPEIRFRLNHSYSAMFWFGFWFTL